MRSHILVVPIAALLLSACSRTPEPAENQSPSAELKAPAASAPAPTATAPAPAAAAGDNRPAGPTPGEIVWIDPAGWQKVAPSSPMRKATYKVPAAPKDPEDGEMAVFFFRGEGGGTEANIQRWIGQFPDAKPADVKRSQRTAGGLNQTIVEVEGTFSSGMPGGSSSPKTQYRLIGAVVETPAGPYFFKLTGPKKTVGAARDAFYKMLDSVKSS
jgi:hypothetical protein